MYNPQLPVPGMMGQPMPQGGNMGVTPPMAPGMAQPGGMGGGVVGPNGPNGPGGMGGLDPAMIQQMLALQQQGPQQQQVQRQIALANQLRGDANSQLQGRRVGAANVGAAIGQSYLAGKQMRDADVREGNLGAQRQGALQTYFNALTGRKREPLPYMGAEGE
jgi:hypothetical protein